MKNGWTKSGARAAALVLMCASCGGGGTHSASDPSGGAAPHGENVAATYFGAFEHDRVQGVSLMPDGRVLIAGETHSRFDLAGAPFSDVPASAHHVWANGAAGSSGSDGFVAILSADLRRLEQWAYIGGCDGDRAYYAQADRDSIYVVGITKSLGVCSSAPFPADVIYGSSGPGDDFDVFVARFDTSLQVRHHLAVFAGSSLGEESARGSMTLITDESGETVAVCLSGTTVSADFPVAALTTVQPSAQLDHSHSGPSDAFLIRLDAALAPQWATFFGGAGEEYAAANVRYHAGLDALFIGGFTTSSDLPLGAAPYDDTLGGAGDGFVARFDAARGALLAATYLGGSLDDFVGFNDDLELTPSGALAVAGSTHSLDFPVSLANAPQTTHSTLGLDADVFVSVLDPSLSSAPSFSTYLGGAGNEEASGLCCDSAGRVFVSGESQSADLEISAASAFDGSFTTAHGANASGYADAFLIGLDPASASSAACLVYGTFLGGDLSIATPGSLHSAPPHGTRGRGLVFDALTGHLIVCGQTTTSDFPTTAGALQVGDAGEEEGFVARHLP